MSPLCSVSHKQRCCVLSLNSQLVSGASAQCPSLVRRQREQHARAAAGRHEAAGDGGCCSQEQQRGEPHDGVSRSEKGDGGGGRVDTGFREEVREGPWHCCCGALLGAEMLVCL